MARAESAADAAVVPALEQALARRPAEARCLIAYSGGLDSSVLLHACASSNRAVVACHVHHGLQASADRFVEHCLREAAKLGVQCTIKMLDGSPPKGESVEAWAREQRYAALIACARELGAQTLLTAHHADDQAETLLMRLARGSGLQGLVGIERASARHKDVLVLRPFLGLRRAELESYAKRHGVVWIDDPMNSEERWLRVSLRSEVMPALSRVAPAFVSQAARSAGLISEAADVIAEVAQADLAQAALEVGASGLDASGVDGSGVDRCMPPAALDVARLAQLGPARRANALRYWLHAHGAPAPSQARLDALLGQVFDSRSAHALWHSSAWCVVKYRSRLQAFGPAAALRPDREPPRPVEVMWQGEERVALREWGLTLAIERTQSAPSDSNAWIVPRDALESGRIEVAHSNATLRVRGTPGAVSRPARKHWQSLGVPPWLRPWCPLLTVAGQPFGIAGLGLTDAGVAFRAAALRARVDEVRSLRLLPEDPRDPRREWKIAYN